MFVVAVKWEHCKQWTKRRPEELTVLPQLQSEQRLIFEIWSCQFMSINFVSVSVECILIVSCDIRQYFQECFQRLNSVVSLDSRPQRHY